MHTTAHLLPILAKHIPTARTNLRLDPKVFLAHRINICDTFAESPIFNTKHHQLYSVCPSSSPLFPPLVPLRPNTTKVLACNGLPRQAPPRALHECRPLSPRRSSSHRSRPSVYNVVSVYARRRRQRTAAEAAHERAGHIGGKHCFFDC